MKHVKTFHSTVGRVPLACDRLDVVLSQFELPGLAGRTQPELKIPRLPGRTRPQDYPEDFRVSGLFSILLFSINLDKFLISTQRVSLWQEWAGRRQPNLGFSFHECCEIPVQDLSHREVNDHIERFLFMVILLNISNHLPSTINIGTSRSLILFPEAIC